jgi:hypothetical protein
MTAPYVIFNVFTKKHSDLLKIHAECNYTQETADLFEIKNEIVNVETFVSDCKDKLEIRVTFNDNTGYADWIEQHQLLYNTYLEHWNKHCQVNQVRWDQYTSDDCYISDFQGVTPYTVKTLIDWKLTAVEKQAFIDHIAPIGSYAGYQGHGKFERSGNLNGARYLKERHGNIRRFGKSPKAHNKNNYPAYILTYHFDHIIEVLQYHLSDLYLRLRKLCYDVEAVAEQYISSCNYAIVIAGHKQLGESLTLHSHMLDDDDRYTFTIAVRLSTDDDKAAVFQAYPPYPDNDPMLPYYFIAPQKYPDAIANHIKDSDPVSIPLTTDTAILAFNASYVAHTVTWTDDIYLFFVYDHVSFKEGVLEQMKQNCEHRYFLDHGPDKCVLYQGMK